MATSMEQAVSDRYAEGARIGDPDLCCPTEFDSAYLDPIPREVLDRDYGCGDPSRYLEEGEEVLDLGSGAGKSCFMASQVVGPGGRVVGVDMTPAMLEVARRNAPVVAERIGYDNVEFRRGRIQDLALDLERVDRELSENAPRDASELLALEDTLDALRQEDPLVESDSFDVVISNCVLNLVPDPQKPRLFNEIHRVLKRGGRAVISDIVSDEPVPEELKRDEELWSGCVSGAYTEAGFLEAFEEAGFYGVRIRERRREPWRTVRGIEFRPVTVEAFKGKEGPCWERHQAVIYRGPFREVEDDDGHRIRRGERFPVCDKTFRIFGREPYREHFELVEPREPVPLEEAEPFDCSRTRPRHPRETKGESYDATTGGDACCVPGESC